MTILVLNLISKCSGSNGSSEAGSEQRNWRDSGLFSLNHALFNGVFIQKVCFPVEQEMLNVYKGGNPLPKASGGGGGGTRNPGG